MSLDVFGEHIDPARDKAKTRYIEVPEAPRFVLEQKDPYGFVYVRRESGQIPAELAGAYTTFDKAIKAVEMYKTKMSAVRREMAAPAPKAEEGPVTTVKAPIKK